MILSILFVFACAMAYLEVVIVVFMERMYPAPTNESIFPISMVHSDHLIEFFREICTMAMLVCAAVLAERRSVLRTFAAFVFLFGVWDLWYYAFLKIILQWPTSWLSFDLLFFIPTPWVGPWSAAALIALLFGVWGGAIINAVSEYKVRVHSVIGFCLGGGLCLYSFLQPVLEYGVQNFGTFVPQTFLWPVFITGYLLMVAGAFSVMVHRSK